MADEKFVKVPKPLLYITAALTIGLAGGYVLSNRGGDRPKAAERYDARRMADEIAYYMSERDAAGVQRLERTQGRRAVAEAANALFNEPGFEDQRRKYRNLNDILASSSLEGALISSAAEVAADRYMWIQKARTMKEQQESVQADYDRDRQRFGGYADYARESEENRRAAEAVLNVQTEQLGGEKSWQTIRYENGRAIQLYVTPQEAESLRTLQKRQDMLNTIPQPLRNAGAAVDSLARRLLPPPRRRP